MRNKGVKLDAGDVLSIDLGNDKYAFARLLSKVTIGHCIEIFKFTGSHPDGYQSIYFESRLMPPQIIDSHSLFWLRRYGNWEVKHKDETFTPSRSETIKFEYGDKSDLFLTDLFDKIESKPADDTGRYPPYIPKGDVMIKRIITFWRQKLSV